MQNMDAEFIVTKSIWNKFLWPWNWTL